MRRLLPLLLAGVLAPAPLLAELVVLAGGGYLKVRRYEVRGDRVRLQLASGGRLTLALSRVERVVEDEISREPLALPDGRFSLRFTDSDSAPETPFAELFLAAARRHSLNPELLAAMARAESAFDPNAISHKGARGLLQLMPATAERFGVSAQELFDPERNLEAAARYLSWLIGRFDGDLRKVLAAYNAGEGTVQRYGGVPPYRETRDYVGRIYADLGLTEGG